MSKYCLFKNDAKYIESYGKLALAVNQRHTTETIIMLINILSSVVAITLDSYVSCTVNS